MTVYSFKEATVSVNGVEVPHGGIEINETERPYTQPPLGWCGEYETELTCGKNARRRFFRALTGYKGDGYKQLQAWGRSK